MELKSSSDRLYKDKTSEIGDKYFISRDEVFLYFKEYDCELLVNDEFFSGNVHDIETIAEQLQQEMQKKQDIMSERNKEISYKTDIFTNNIIRAAKLLKVDSENSEIVYAKSGKYTKGHIMKIIMKQRPFILINAQPLSCNGIEAIEANGVYKIQKVIKFNCSISGQNMQHLGQTIGRNIEKMEGQLIRNCRKKDPKFYMPRLFSFKNMRKKQWEGQIIRNYNLLQCCNMAGLLQLDPDETFKVIHSVISFDIKSAYMSVIINQPIFPGGDLTVIDLNPEKAKKDYTGRAITYSPYGLAIEIVKRIEEHEKKNQWYFLSIDPNYNGDNPVVLEFLRILKPFRRNFSKHPGTELKFVNQDQMISFLKWDKNFYDDYYSIYTELSFEDLMYNILLMCPDAKVVIMYSKNASNYLPKLFRDSKIELYRLKDDHVEREKEIVKMYTEQTYGKGLQLHNFQDDEEVMKHICNETINISQSLTCCSYTRYRLVSDWQGFTPLYLDSDSIKFRFGPEHNNLLELMQRQEELNSKNKADNICAGYPDLNLGSWNVDGVYDYMMFLRKKCYIGYKNDATTEIKLAGCLKEAYTKYFEGATLDTLKQIEATEQLIIPNGGVSEEKICPENEFSYYRTHDIIYSKKKSN